MIETAIPVLLFVAFNRTDASLHSWNNSNNENYRNVPINTRGSKIPSSVEASNKCQVDIFFPDIIHTPDFIYT